MPQCAQLRRPLAPPRGAWLAIAIGVGVGNAEAHARAESEVFGVLLGGFVDPSMRDGGKKGCADVGDNAKQNTKPAPGRNIQSLQLRPGPQSFNHNK